MKMGAALFSCLMGLMMLGTWLYLFLFGKYPQAREVPLETSYLLVAEFLTSFALIAGGVGIFTGREWGIPLLLVALGELIYCTIRFAGELGQGGSMQGLGFFSVVGVVGIAFAVLLIISASRGRGSF